MLPKIETPTFEVEVPSTKEKVTMRCMKVKEEKILLMAKQGDDPLEILAAIKQVVNNCMVSKLDVDEVAMFDLELLFVRLRAQSISDIAEVSYRDNGEVAHAMEELKKAEKDDDERTEAVLTAEKQEEILKKATRTFKIELADVKVVFPKDAERTIKLDDKSGIILKYPPAKLYSDKDFINAKPEDVLDKLIENSIETIYTGEEQTDPTKEDKEKMGEWLENLDIKTHNKMLEFFTNVPHLFYEIKYTNNLGKDQTIELKTLNDFFQFA
jgi:hypothetical protein